MWYLVLMSTDALGRSTARYGKQLGTIVRESTDNGRELIQILLCIARDDLWTMFEGELVRQHCKVSDRQAAIDRLTDRGFGKVSQEIELTMPELSPAQAAIADMTVIEMQTALNSLGPGVIEGEFETAEPD